MLKYRTILDPVLRIKEAKSLFDDFLLAGSPNELNVDACQLQAVVEFIHTGDSHLFDPIFVHILTILISDQLPKFRIWTCQRDKINAAALLKSSPNPSQNFISVGPKKKSLFRI